MAEEQTKRDKFPTLTETNDLVTHIGVLTVDNLNRTKIINDLWINIDVFLDKEAKIAISLTEKDAEIKRLLTQVEDQQAKLDGFAQKQNEKRLEFEHELNILQEALNSSSSAVSSMEKEVTAIEAKAVIDQESFRAVAQGELGKLEKKVGDLQTRLEKATAKAPVPAPKKRGRKQANG